MRLYFENSARVRFTTSSGMVYDVLVFPGSAIAVPRDIDNIEIKSFADKK